MIVVIITFNSNNCNNSNNTGGDNDKSIEYETARPYQQCASREHIYMGSLL